ncbi:hypothetical protein GUJ93_ZPchr0012g20500 [Zizania palustris]|uniref:Uncharacterized protein n=1 Tax=Zizania palustris TaxID=103762 RepID=A0A8J5WP01_ZIZPA|nr:hypothetical protein GUJ93_ZPchr0012g20500 [Zizania palustris]
MGTLLRPRPAVLAPASRLPASPASSSSAHVVAGGGCGVEVERRPHRGVSTAFRRPGPHALAAGRRRRDTVVRSDFAVGGAATAASAGDSPQALSEAS